MAKGKNCPNCGAPYSLESDKCPYCGTLYYDLTAINFDEQTPFFLKIKVNNAVITQKVRPKFGSTSIIIEDNPVYAVGARGPLMAVHSAPTITTSLDFETLPMEGGNLCTMVVEE